MDDAALLSRVRDYLFENGPALPHEVATACDVPVSVVTRMVREGTLEEIRPAETTSCEACNTHGIVGSLCPACRKKFTPPTEDEPTPLRPRETVEAAPRRERPRFHVRRV
jgi:hypothetical protein